MCEAPTALPPISAPISRSQSIAPPPQQHGAHTERKLEPPEREAEAEAGWEGCTEKQTCRAYYHETRFCVASVPPRAVLRARGLHQECGVPGRRLGGLPLPLAGSTPPTPTPPQPRPGAGAGGPAPLSLGLACASPLAMCVRLHVYDSFQSSFSPHKIFILVVQGPVIAISHPELFIPCTD